LASIRMNVISRCRSNPHTAVTAPTPSSANAHRATAPASPRWSPSSTAREMISGGNVSSAIHVLLTTTATATRPRWAFTSHHRNRPGPRTSGVPGSA
jgi:hypothetical protein